jgi:hypothetical protein
MRSACRPFAVLALLLPLALLTAALPATDVPQCRFRCRVAAVDGQPPAADQVFTFYPSTFPRGASAKGSAWSDEFVFDIDHVTAAQKLYPNLYLNRYPLVLKLNTRPAKGNLTVEVQLRWYTPPPPDQANDAAADTADLTGEHQYPVTLRDELFGDTLGFLLWRDDQRLPQAATMATYEQRFWQHLEGVALRPEQRPRHFPIIDRYIGGDDSKAAWHNGIASLSKAGFSALMLPASPGIREELLATGLRRTAGAIYNPPGYAFDHDPAITPEAITKWAQDIAAPYLKAGFERTDMALYAMSDEPGWYFPSQFASFTKFPTLQPRFTAYLAQQGLTPADVGATEWAQVLPIGRSQAGTLPANRLFYWTTRFYAWDSARHFAASTKALEEAFYPGLPIITNWNFFSGRHYFHGPFGNNPDKASADSGMGCHDWFEFARLRGCTMLWTEDWFADDRAWQWSFYASKLDSAARLGNITWGAYVIPRTSGQRRDGLMQKVLSVVGHGGKAIKYFVFGPEYNFPGNCYSERPELLPRLAEAHAMVGAAEPFLWPGRRPASPVAIVQPRSSLPWDPYDPKREVFDATNNAPERHTVDYLAEVYGLYLGLQHANQPADWLDEDGLTAAGLAQTRVLYLTAPDLPTEAQAALAEWVKAGGTLVTVSGAAAYDRYHQPDSTLRAALGLPTAGRDRLLVPDVRKLPEVAQGTGQAGAFTAFGARDALAANSGDVLGTFADGSPAVIARQVGRGRVIHYAWLPGCSYVPTGKDQADHLPVGFAATTRAWINLPVQLAQVTPPVSVDVPLVETPILLSDVGAAVTLLNWTGQPLERVTLTVRLPFTPKEVRAVRAGTLTATPVPGGVQLRLPLAAADIVTFAK